MFRFLSTQNICLDWEQRNCHSNFLLSSLPTRLSVVCWQTVWTQIEPDKMLGLIWIQTVWHLVVLLKDIFQNLILKRNADNNEAWTFPSMHRVNDCDHLHSKTCQKRPLSKRPKIGFQDQLSHNAGQKYCRMAKGSILQYFRPSLSYHLSLRSMFWLFLSGHLRQVLM